MGFDSAREHCMWSMASLATPSVIERRIPCYDYGLLSFGTNFINSVVEIRVLPNIPWTKRTMFFTCAFALSEFDSLANLLSLRRVCGSAHHGCVMHGCRVLGS